MQRAAASRADSHPLLDASRLLELVSQHNLTVALDLKGGDHRPDAHAQHLLWLAERIRRAPGLAERAFLYVESTEGARKLRRRLRLAQTAPPLTLVKPIRDRGVPPPADGGDLDCAASQLERADAGLFSRLGPSAKCGTQRLIGAPWARARWTMADSLIVWVVDDAPTLEGLLRRGVRHVVSNRPLHVRALATALCKAHGQGRSGGVEHALNCADRGSHTCTV